MRQAAFFQGMSNIIIHSYSLTVDGVNIASAPYFLMNRDANYIQVVDNIKNALENNKYDVPHPLDWSEFNRDFERNIGISSKSLNKDYVCCLILKKENVIKIVPSKRVNKSGGFLYLNDLSLELNLSASDKEIYDALLEVLSFCQE